MLAAAAMAAAACGPEHDGRVELDEPVTTISPSISPSWSRSIANAYGVSLALDQSGNLLVAGSIPFTSIVTAKYDPAGTLLWQQVFDAPSGRAQAAWIAVDGAGNAFVAGSLVVGSFNDPAGFVVLEYDPSGALLWQDVLPMTWGKAVRVATDAGGNAYVTGRGWLGGSATYTDYVTMKFAPDGTRLWMRTHDFHLSTDIASSLAVAPDGTVAVTGSPSGGSPMVTVVYDTDGTLRWSQGSQAGTANDVAFGPAGEVYVAGGTGNVVVVKHDAAGNVLWASANPGFTGYRLALDAAGNAFITGVAVQTYGMPYTDWVTMKLDPAGALVWSQRYDAHDSNDEIPRALAVTSDGGVVVTGQGGPGPTSGTLSDLQMVTVEYGAAGVPAWIATTFDAPNGVAVKVLGGSVFAVSQALMTTSRLERVAAAAAPIPPADPAPPPPALAVPAMKVTDIWLDGTRLGRTRVDVTGRVEVRDPSGAVAGAAVTATWTLPKGLKSTATRLTDASGAALFVMAGPPGTYTLTVNDVARTGEVFDAAASVLSRSIKVR